MRLTRAIAKTLRNKRFWLWQLSGAIIYSIPVAIRFFSGNVIIPILNFPGFWIGHFIPGNFLEKFIGDNHFYNFIWRVLCYVIIFSTSSNTPIVTYKRMV